MKLKYTVAIDRRHTKIQTCFESTMKELNRARFPHLSVSHAHEVGPGELADSILWAEQLKRDTQALITTLKAQRRNRRKRE